MKNISIEYDARMYSEQEAKFCKDVTDIIKNSSLNITHLRFARKPKSFGAETWRVFYSYIYSNGKQEVMINLANVNNFGHAIQEVTERSAKKGTINFFNRVKDDSGRLKIKKTSRVRVTTGNDVYESNVLQPKKNEFCINDHNGYGLHVRFNPHEGEYQLRGENVKVEII